MDSTDVISAFTSAVGETGDTLVGTVPVILVLFATLVGLGIAIRYFKKWIGRKA